jgi:hypothetical protein
MRKMLVVSANHDPRRIGVGIPVLNGDRGHPIRSLHRHERAVAAARLCRAPWPTGSPTVTGAMPCAD